MRPARGFTLIEMVVFIVILGVGITGTLAAIVQASRGAADPILQLRAAELGKRYLDEVMAVPYEADDGIDKPCDERGDFAELECYNGLSDQPPRRANGKDMDVNYGDWTVEVGVSDSPTSPSSWSADSGASADGRWVTITVTPPGTGSIQLRAFRAEEN